MRHTVMLLGYDIQECLLQEVVVADWGYYTVIQVNWTDGRVEMNLVTLVDIQGGVRTGHLYNTVRRVYFSLLLAVKAQRGWSGGIAPFFLRARCGGRSTLHPTPRLAPG